MTKMAAMHTYGINPLKSSFQESKANFDETCYEALETQAYYIFVQMITLG